MTPRQQDVFCEVRKGLSNKEIARNLGISEATVKLHLKEVFKEVGVHSRWELLAKHGDTTSASEPTNEQILADFTNTVFDTLDRPWAERVLAFGRRLLRPHDTQI